MRLREVMTRWPVTVTPETTVAAAAVLLRRRGVSALPVVEDGCLVGIVTTSDLLGVLTDPGVLVDVVDASPDGAARTTHAALPRDPISVPLGPGDPRPARTPARPTALVVDPVAATRLRMAEELAADGYEVTSCPGPTTATRCPARDGADGKRCTRLPADVAFVAVDQGSARTRLLEAYTAWAPDAHLRVTGTLTAPANPSEPPRPQVPAGQGRQSHSDRAMRPSAERAAGATLNP